MPAGTFFYVGENYKLHVEYTCGIIMTLDEYAEFGLYDVGLQLVRLQSFLQKFGIVSRLEIRDVALYVYKDLDALMQESPIFEIGFDVETYEVAVLSMKTCGDYWIHPYLSWLWSNLSVEMKASMMRVLLKDPENCPKKNVDKIPT